MTGAGAIWEDRTWTPGRRRVESAATRFQLRLAVGIVWSRIRNPFVAVRRCAGTHDHFAQPFYSWIPSIGVSSLLVSNGPLFKLWSGDLIVSSLKTRRSTE